MIKTYDDVEHLDEFPFGCLIQSEITVEIIDEQRQPTGEGEEYLVILYDS